MATDPTSTRRALMRCLTSSWLLAPLALAATALPITWYIVALLQNDARTVAARYTIWYETSSTYGSWGLAMLIVGPVLWAWTPITLGIALCGDSGRAGRWLLYLTVGAFGAVLASGHALSAKQTRVRRGDEARFASAFNRGYCRARTFEACVRGDEDAILMLTARINESAVVAAAPLGTAPLSVLREAESVADAAFSIWTRCLETREQVATQSLSGQNVTVEGGLSVAPVYRLVGDFPSSRATDAWCGALALRSSPPSDAEHLAPPAPFAAHARVFDEFAGEWTRRMEYSDAMLGSTMGCMLLTAWLLKLREAWD